MHCFLKVGMACANLLQEQVLWAGLALIRVLQMAFKKLKFI